MGSQYSYTTQRSAPLPKLPGLGLPLNQSSQFPTAIESWRAQPRMVRERAMLAVMAALKDKPDWERKVLDETIVAKWRHEALKVGEALQQEAPDPWGAVQQGMSMNAPARQKEISGAMFDYCIAELRDTASGSQSKGFTEVLEADATVYISDTAVDQPLKRALQSAVLPLENVREEEKDWHPGSDGKVLDLVHPSLFPLAYGTSRILTEKRVPLDGCSEFIGQGEVVPVPEEEPSSFRSEGTRHYSRKYQWLPCEVALDNSGGTKITSYINNLHPEDHGELYGVVEKIIAKSVPMWKEALTSTITTRGQQRMTLDGGDGLNRLVKFGPEKDPSKPYDDNYDDDDYEFDDEFVYEIQVPEPPAYCNRPRDKVRRNYRAPHHLRSSTPEEARIGLDASFARGLQVIVKLANIHLTPERHFYDGGSWHVEGLQNEHICASALYYYDSKNVTTSHLAFRENVDASELSDSSYEQDRHEGLREVYGIGQYDGLAMQVLGKINTREDRLLVFPNVLQHRVLPFELDDLTKPGHRKLLALFLVDPGIRIPSTANVPPQQRDWWARRVRADNESALGGLPPEMFDQVMQGVEGFPMTTEDAKRVREELMDERKVQGAAAEEEWSKEGYCFCEH